MNTEELHERFLRSLDVNNDMIRVIVEGQEERDDKRLRILATLQATFTTLTVFTEDEELKKRLLLLVELIDKM